MKIYRPAALAAFLGVSASASSALAAPGNSVTIAFTSQAAAVPLSPITLVALGLGIGGLAIAFIGRRHGWRMMAPALAMVIGATAVFASSEARAAPKPHSLVTSGETFDLGNRENTFTNNTGVAIRLTQIDVQHQAGYFTTNAVGSCNLVDTIAPGGTCVINLDQFG